MAGASRISARRTQIGDRLSVDPVHRCDGAATTAEVVFVLLEEARLRCERFGTSAVTDRQRVALRRIHRELSMATRWTRPLDADRHRLLTGIAAQNAARAMVRADAAHQLGAVLAWSEDAVSDGVAHRGGEDLHAAQVHLLRAMELLPGVIFAPELADLPRPTPQR